jgi:hypothetical protein
LSKAELKKQEARFKEHEMLTQNAKLVEEQEKRKEQQRLKLEKLEEQKKADVAIVPEESKQPEVVEPSSLIVEDQVPDVDIDIESYHSS